MSGAETHTAISVLHYTQYMPRVTATCRDQFTVSAKICENRDRRALRNQSSVGDFWSLKNEFETSETWYVLVIYMAIIKYVSNQPLFMRSCL